MEKFAGGRSAGCPDVSVVMAVRNEQKYIREAIESILRQGGLNLELIVVDDRSTDETVRIVSEIAETDRRLRLLSNLGAGKVSAFNLGMAEARGAWACIFAGDDIMPNGSLRKRYEAVKDRPVNEEPLNGICRLVTFSENPKLNGQVVPRRPNKPNFSGVCYLMNRGSISLMWPVPEILPNEDTWLELAAQYLEIPYHCTPTIGCAWRIHSGNSINMLVPWQEFSGKITARMEANRLFLERYRDKVTARTRRILEARVKCESARRNGSLLGILTSGASPIAVLRAASMSNALLYEVRRRAFKFLSGW